MSWYSESISFRSASYIQCTQEVNWYDQTVQLINLLCHRFPRKFMQQMIYLVATSLEPAGWLPRWTNPVTAQRLYWFWQTMGSGAYWPFMGVKLQQLIHFIRRFLKHITKRLWLKWVPIGLHKKILKHPNTKRIKKISRYNLIAFTLTLVNCEKTWFIPLIRVTRSSCQHNNQCCLRTKLLKAIKRVFIKGWATLVDFVSTCVLLFQTGEVDRSYFDRMLHLL